MLGFSAQPTTSYAQPYEIASRHDCAAGNLEFIDRHVGALQLTRFFQPNLSMAGRASLR